MRGPESVLHAVLPGRDAEVEKDILKSYLCFFPLQGIDSFCVTPTNYIISFHFKKPFSLTFMESVQVQPRTLRLVPFPHPFLSASGHVYAA